MLALPHFACQSCACLVFKCCIKSFDPLKNIIITIEVNITQKYHYKLHSATVCHTTQAP